MTLDHDHPYTMSERTSSKVRCPECRSRLAISWRRASRPGRSEDLFTIAKSSCPNRCDYRAQDVAWRS